MNSADHPTTQNHHRQQRPADPKNAVQIDVDGLHPGGFIIGMHGIGHAERGPGVVDQNVQGVEPIGDGTHHLGDAVSLRDVQIDSQRLHPVGVRQFPGNIRHLLGCPGFNGQLRIRGFTQVGDHHIGPFRGQFCSHGIADAGSLARTGHHGCFSHQLLIHLRPHWKLYRHFKIYNYFSSTIR